MSTRRSGAEQSTGVDADGLYEEVQEAAEEVGEFLTEQMSENPYLALAAAAALGYALGLPRGALALLTGLGSRVALGWFENLFEESPSARATPKRRRRSRPVHS